MQSVPIRPLSVPEGVGEVPDAVRREDHMAVKSILAEARAAGIELRVDGSRLRVLGDARGYTPALRAKILANKPELVALLQRESVDAARSYDDEEKAWAVG